MYGRKIVLGVSGGIAVYKVVNLVSLLTKSGADVQVIMTESASKFVTPLTFQTMSRNHVITDIFAEQNPKVVSHIDIADQAELFVVAPATANILAKMVHGIADDMLSTTLLANTAPILVAPAMNVHMYQHPAVQNNIKILKERGVMFVEPDEGLLACGYTGKGRLAEPSEIFSKITEIFHYRQDFKGKKVLVTAGGTREPIDPVRFITNRSSGKTGYLIAEALKKRGAEVILISGITQLTPPKDVNFIQVETALEMYQAVMNVYDQVDIVIKSAAVADYRVENEFKQKIKKKDDRLELILTKNPDILFELGKRKKGQFLVGFAAETENLEEYAKKKLVEKNLDLIVANNVGKQGRGFDVDMNEVIFITKNGERKEIPLAQKSEVASLLLDFIKDLIIKGER